MEQIQEPQNDIIDGFNDITTIEMNCLTKESITTLEDLSNELIYEIFEFVNFHHAFQSFYDLNQRFENLFIRSNLPIKIDISSISKSTFQRYLEDIIIPHADRIKSIRLSNPFATEMCLLLLPIMTNFTRLEALTLNNIESNFVGQVVDALSSLPVLSSLTIGSTSYINNPNDIYGKIFRLPTLKYCEVLLETYGEPLSTGTNQFNSIEHLLINKRVSFDQLDCLLSYVPQLHRLSMNHLNGFNNSRPKRSSLILNCLTNVSLRMNCVNFNDFESIVKDYFRQVQVLRIVVKPNELFSTNTEYINADRWEKLISTSIPNLRVFDFQHISCRWYYNTADRQALKATTDKFNSIFWTKREWFFEYQYHPQSDGAIFYSRNPYGRKDYTSDEVQAKNMWSSAADINDDPIHHVYLHNTRTMKQSMGNFPNANELTLLETVELPRDSIANSLQLILPLKQLTRLTLNCHNFSFEQLIELFQFTENVHTLKIVSVLLNGTDSISMQQSKIFRIASKTNTVTKMIIDKTIRLEQIQLLVALFPRLEHLIIDLYKQDLKSIARYLWSELNSNTRHLCFLSVSHEREDLMKELRLFIESEKLLHSHSVKVFEQKLHLWW